MRGFDDHNTSGYHHDRRKQAVITAFVENPASRVLLCVSFALCPLSLNVSPCVCVRAHRVRFGEFVSLWVHRASRNRKGRGANERDLADAHLRTGSCGWLFVSAE